MGMFDYVIISTDMLPVSDEEKIRIGSNPGWQTKSLDNLLSEVYINDSGELNILNFDLEEIPKDVLTIVEDSILSRSFGDMRRINERLDFISYTGTVVFYTSVSEDWYEFTATFVLGKLVSLE
jgi:hypothetical protein